jgi:hypothetical protein
VGCEGCKGRRRTYKEGLYERVKARRLRISLAGGGRVRGGMGDERSFTAISENDPGYIA